MMGRLVDDAMTVHQDNSLLEISDRSVWWDAGGCARSEGEPAPHLFLEMRTQSGLRCVTWRDCSLTGTSSGGGHP